MIIIMVNLLKRFFIIFFFLFCFLSFPRLSYATVFDLIAPPGPFQRGQEIVFTININTEGTTLNNTSVGMTYDTNYLEYVNTLPGNTFNTITTDNLGAGKIVFYGNSSTGFSGSGKFTDVTFRLIAQAPGSTELCVLWNPSTAPTNPPTTSAPTQKSTAAPVSGNNNYSDKLNLIAAGFITFSASLLLFERNINKKVGNKKIRNPRSFNY